MQGGYGDESIPKRWEGERDETHRQVRSGVGALRLAGMEAKATGEGAWAWQFVIRMVVADTGNVGPPGI